MIDLIQASKASVVFVSRHYLGSINHTLLSLEALLRRNIPVQGLIFNGDSNPDTEHAIETHSGLPILGQIRDETTIDRAMIEKYAAIFRDQI